jgi:hypothetical protein
MNITCKAFEEEVWGEDHPCYMCGCGFNDGQPMELDCCDCEWVGCNHPECPVSCCRDRSEDKCLYGRDGNILDAPDCHYKNCPKKEEITTTKSRDIPED